MSSGSSTRKPNASTAAFKASSGFINGSLKPGGMKRQRQTGDGAHGDVVSAESNSDQSKLCVKKRFVGVRQRPSGRWVAEIKDTTQKIRLWLGTFDSAEEGAKAYDSAARALRGANTRTNFVPAMASEGASAPASKAARLIRLRQMAAAAKATSCSEKLSDSQGADLKLESPEVIDSPAPHVVRPNLQHSTSSSSSLDLPSPDAAADAAAAPSDKPPPRLVDRRHNVSPSPQPDYHNDGDGALPFAAIHDHGTVDNGSPKLHFPSPKLEPQQSITSETLSDATTRSSSIPSPGSHFECVQPVNTFADQLSEMESAFKLESLVTTSAALETLRPPPSHLVSSCATNRDHVSAYPSERDEVTTDETFIFREKENLAEMEDQDVADIPWPEYTMLLPGLDESSGVYTSAFDFAMDRDSCTSVDPHADEFLALRMLQDERGMGSSHDNQCVLLTHEPLDSISASSCQPHDHVWKPSMEDVDCCWDGLSSGSTEEVRIIPRGDGGEDPVCVDVGDHDVWSSMDLPPLCMVA